MDHKRVQVLKVSQTSLPLTNLKVKSDDWNDPNKKRENWELENLFEDNGVFQHGYLGP